jgi:hypothetical protein
MSGALNATANQVSWLYSRAKDTQAMIDLIKPTSVHGAEFLPFL